MTERTYEPKVGWSRLISVTGGTFPDYDDYLEAFDVVCSDTNRFEFGNDKFVGTCSLTAGELWDELHTVWETRSDGENDEEWERDYSWCSDVLGKLGWEWI